MHNDAQISNAQIRNDAIADGKNLLWKNNPYFCTESDIPGNLNDVYVKLERSVTQKDFSLQARVMAGLNIAGAVAFACNNKIHAYSSADAEDFFVSTRTGDVKIIIDNHESTGRVFTESEDVNSSCINSFPQEETMVRLAAYLTFRLLCLGDPFDGKQTLVEYPFLSKSATAIIHSGKYGLIVEKGENSASGYIGAEVLSRWKALPKFFRAQMVEALHAQSDKCETDSTVWLNNIRKLRDCLVFVNGQYRFCDPDLPINLLFMKVRSYKVPVWPKKALYWYHIGDSAVKTGNGVIAGVNGDGVLENHSDLTWCIEYGTLKEFIDPKRSVKPASGMIIKMNDVVVEIVDGSVSSPKNKESDITSKQDTLRTDNAKEGVISQDADNTAQQDNTSINKAETDFAPISDNNVIDHSD